MESKRQEQPDEHFPDLHEQIRQADFDIIPNRWETKFQRIYRYLADALIITLCLIILLLMVEFIL